MPKQSTKVSSSTSPKAPRVTRASTKAQTESGEPKDASGDENAEAGIPTAADIEGLLDGLIAAKASDSKRIKEEVAKIRELKSVYQRQARALKRHKKFRTLIGTSTRGSNNMTGLDQPARLLPPLCDFLNVPHDTLLPRREVSRRLNAYVKENGLEDPKNRQIILLNEPLTKLFGGPEERLQRMEERKKTSKSKAVPTSDVTHFNMQVHLNRYFEHVKRDEPSAPQDAPATTAASPATASPQPTPPAGVATAVASAPVQQQTQPVAPAVASA